MPSSRLISGGSGLVVVVDNLAKAARAINIAVQTKVYVGVPGEKAGRRAGSISNASLAYIHEHGAPGAHIPPRPFLYPGVKSVENEIEAGLLKAMKVSLDGRPEAVERELSIVGMKARDAVKNKISEGIPPPLAPSTIRGRIRRVKGNKRRKKIKAALAGGAPASVQAGYEEYSTGLFTPLIITGQLRNSINYVLRRDDKDTIKT